MRPATLLLCAFSLSAQTQPAPSPEEQTAIIKAARENALGYTKTLPDFLCTQTVSRYSGTKSGNGWKLNDTLEMSVAYTSAGERYKLEKIDGRPTTRPLRQAGGFQSHGEFGSMLRNVFRPASAAEFKWQRWITLRDRRTHVYSFRIPLSRSGYKITWGNVLKRNSIATGLGGEVFVDGETLQVVRIVSEAEGIPGKSAVHRSYGSLDYGYVQIAGTQFLLPVRVESNLEMKSGHLRNISEFSDYRKFSGEASISFEAQAP